MTTFTYRNSKASKLSPGQVLDIRERYAKGATQAALARQFRVTVTQIGRIVRGESWQSLPETPPQQGEMEATLQRLLAVQAEVKSIPNPMETGELPAGETDGRATERLQRFLKDRNADSLLKELTQPKGNDEHGKPSNPLDE